MTHVPDVVLKELRKSARGMIVEYLENNTFIVSDDHSKSEKQISSPQMTILLAEAFTVLCVLETLESKLDVDKIIKNNLAMINKIAPTIVHRGLTEAKSQVGEAAFKHESDDFEVFRKAAEEVTAAIKKAQSDV